MEVQNLANSLVRLNISDLVKVLVCVETRSSLLGQIRAQQFDNAKLCNIFDKVLNGEAKESMHDNERVLRIKARMCVPRVGVHIIHNAEKLARIYIREIMRLHGVPVLIISDRDLLRESLDKVKLIQEKLLAAQSRLKVYADWKVRELEFMEGEQVFLKISPMNGVIRFGKKDKLSPSYIGPFEIPHRVGVVTYELALPPGLSGVHLVFHVSMLKRYHSDGSYIICWDSMFLNENYSYKEEPIAILNRQVRKLRSKEIASIKVQ
ncbi:uncharacterized protein LOC132043883 [Lycium ferocissimum]|uniref:uncharacterized protein LOC132043883 n=1 Tax=Lycium ferocissimum TaxID=112874 RepID=UPI002814FFDC|nr:uncharacterized protein LOC132043883 [Lycium ferocissimum]